MKKTIFIGLLFPFFLAAQDYIDFEQIFRISSPSFHNSLALTVHLPRTISGRQKLEGLEFSVQPGGIVDEEGAYYAHFDNDILVEHKEVMVKSSLILYRNDLYTAKKRAAPLEIEEDLTPYLRKEAHLEINAKSILNTAIGLKGTDEESSVRNIFNFVIDHLEYYNFRNQERSARLALKQGKGDCTEYSELMIALCRAIGIPARYVNGFVARSSSNPRHNWVEVYFSEYGWVAFDPTYADSEYGKATFDKMQNIYIYTLFERSDPISGWRNFGINGTELTYSYKATNFLEKAIKKINRKLQQNKKEQAKLLIDSLIAHDIQDYRLFNYQAKLYLEEDKLDLALVPLQRALRHCYFPMDKRESHFYFAIYHSKMGDVDLAFRYFKKALEMGYQLKPKEIDSLMEDDIFTSLRALDTFDELTISIQKRYQERKKNKNEYTFLYEDLYLLDPHCQAVAGNTMPFDLQALTEELILQQKVRKIKMENDWMSIEYHFSKTGKELSRRNIWNNGNYYSEINYDATDRKIGITYQNVDEDQDTSYTKLFYQYEEDCLVSVKYCDFDCSMETAKTMIQIDRSIPDTTSVLTLNHLTNEEQRRKYLFDEQNRILSTYIFDHQDTMKIDWVYKDEENTQIKYIDREQCETWKRNDNGQLLERTRKNSSTSYTYNRKSQLIKEILKHTYQQKTSVTEYRYQYYKNGLVKSRQIKNNYMNKFMNASSFEYEFYD